MTSTILYHPRHRVELAPSTSAASLSRRGALALVGAGVGALVLPSQAFAAPSARSVTTSSLTRAAGRFSKSAGRRPDALKIIGMSSPAKDWSARISQVGKSGITARRIFAQLNADASDQMDLVEQAHADGMMPIFSFKVNDLEGAARGTYDAAVGRLARRLAEFGKPTRCTFWHEPADNMSGEQFAAIQRRFVPRLKEAANVRQGPFINGWLLDRQLPLFTTYAPKDLLAAWDFMGIDTYESGTIGAPGAVKPADRLPKLVRWLRDQGHPDKPIGIGEYNGYSGATIAAAGAAFLSCDQLEFACMWNATTGKGYVLTGERLSAFKGTKGALLVRR